MKKAWWLCSECGKDLQTREETTRRAGRPLSHDEPNLCEDCRANSNQRPVESEEVRIVSASPIPEVTETLPEKTLPPSIQPSDPTFSPLDLPAHLFKEGLDRRGANRKALISWVHDALHEGIDFGSIPTSRGLSKPSLWKPGAEKICGMLGVTTHFPTLSLYEDKALRGEAIEFVVLRCELRTGGHVVAEGIGARRVLETDRGDINKGLKMAAKSAHIDATLRLAGLSEVFTQDIEDMIEANGELPDAGYEGPPATPQNRATEYVDGSCEACGALLVRKWSPKQGRHFINCELDALAFEGDAHAKAEIARIQGSQKTKVKHTWKWENGK